MREARPMSEHEYHTQAQKAFDQVFRSSDPFDQPFNSSIERRAILYPLTYELDPIELQAVAAAARAFGDTALYLSFAERPAE